MIPKEQKVTEKYLRRVLISSICSILLCMSCLVGTTWAWFAVSVENTGNVIQIATVETDLTIENGENTVTKSEDGSYSLEVGTYTVGIQAASNSTASDSELYAVFSIDDAPAGYIALEEDTSVATYTDSNQIRRFVAKLTIKANKKCKFSWEVAWMQPDSAEPLTDGAITVKPAEEMTGRSIHISFDDVEKCFNNLKSNQYTSLYDEPFFGWLKGLHDTYGAKFSLYVYYSDLAGVPATYAEEFAAASDWLKIGFHADNASNSAGFSTYDQGMAAWNTFVGYVKTITGTTDSIDRMPRLHYFAGSQAALNGMKYAECGALGFLAADDSRNSYYFDSTTSSNLYNTDYITDHNNGLVFLSTDMRGDWFLSTFTSSNNYCKPTHDTVYEEMQDRYSSDAYSGMLEWCIFFSHEWQFYDGTTLGAGKVWTEDACKFAKDNGIAFGYPQGYTFSKTEYDIPVDDGTTAVFDSVKLKVVDDFSKVQFINGYTINGSGLQYEEKTARAISKTEVLNVSDSMRKLSLDLAKLSIKDQLYYTVYEFSDRPLDSSTFMGNGGTFTQDDVTLADATKYVIIIFKNETGADFAAEDFALLNQCVSFSEVVSSGGTNSDDNTETDTDTDGNTGTETDTNKTTTTRDGETVAIVSDLADILYVHGSFEGNQSVSVNENITGRAISRYYVLKVNGGETLTLIQNISGVNLYFGIKEFTGVPLTAENITSGGQTYNSWLSDPVTLHNDTRYIVIGFKNGEGTVEFTDEQLRELSRCLVISESAQAVTEEDPTDPPATEPPATESPVTEPPATELPTTDPTDGTEHESNHET